MGIPANAQRKPGRSCYDTFDDFDCNSGFQKRGNRCVFANVNNQVNANNNGNNNKINIDNDVNNRNRGGN